jgi:CheY-like chemotaxis protein
LVEDNAGDVLLIKQVLSQATCPLALRVALDGEQALQILADSEFKPRLMILDLNLPKVQGLQVLECAIEPNFSALQLNKLFREREADSGPAIYAGR